MRKTLPASNVIGSRDLFNPFYEKLKRSSDEKLLKMIQVFLDDLKRDLTIGIKVRKRQWPRCYVKKYKITNLYKHNLGSRYRVTYTILSQGEKKVGVVIECMNHDAYNKRFDYTG